MHDGCWPNTSRTIMKIALTTPWRRNRRGVGPSPSVPLHNRRSLGFPEWAVSIIATNGPGRLELGLTIGPSSGPVMTYQVHASQPRPRHDWRRARVRDVTHLKDERTRRTEAPPLADETAPLASSRLGSYSGERQQIWVQSAGLLEQSTNRYPEILGK